MKKKEIVWKENGWTLIQEADAVKHILEIACNAENGTVIEVRVRHNDGEEIPGKVTYKGEPVLPVALEEFKKMYLKDALDIQ